MLVSLFIKLKTPCDFGHNLIHKGAKEKEGTTTMHNNHLVTVELANTLEKGKCNIL